MSSTALTQVRSLVSPRRLTEFFAPRSIAVVGASDTSGWARYVFAAAAATRFSGPLVPVHPAHETVFGRPAVPSLRDLAAPVDLAFIMAPAQAVECVLDDAAAAGVRGAIVLASGYAESGQEGRALEQRLSDRAAAHGITLLGPNCLGFLNAHACAGPFALTVPLPLLPGPVGIALQSGALASVVLAFARSHAIGVSTLVTLGNEAMITAADVIEYLVEDESTRVICLFLEEISDPVRFAAAARQADLAGKPIVAIKVGSSPAGQQAALAHTGAVAGDDAVVDTALRRWNVIRVRGIEEMLCTAALLGYARRPRGRRMGVLTSSGGACDIIADRASAEGIEIPPFDPATVTAIAPYVPPFARVANPLDVTGYFLANRRTSALTAIDHALDAAVSDPGLDFVLFAGPALPDTRPPEHRLADLIDERIGWLGERVAAAPIPVICVNSTCVDVTEYGRSLLTHRGLHPLAGLDLGLRAIGNALRWHEGRGRARATAARPAATATTAAATAATIRDLVRTAPGAGPWPETKARELLAALGLPMVPAELVTSADAAVEAASRLGFPVALKICSAQIPHKSQAGGVALGLATADQVRTGYQAVRAAAEPVAGASIDGVLVAPMRTGGIELLAGVTVDPAFGPVLAVGLGGIWVEVLADVSLRLLPVDVAEVARMLGELRGAPLLRGTDLDALARVITEIGDAAVLLDGQLRASGSALHSLEVNPLRVGADQIEALDILIVTPSRTESR